jgi:hypothetical protein
MSSGVQKAMDEGRMKTWGDNCNWSGKNTQKKQK